MIWWPEIIFLLGMDAGPVTTVSGPSCVSAAQVLLPGPSAATVLQPGPSAAIPFLPGPSATMPGC